MKYVGIENGWKKLACKALKNAMLEGDFDCVYNSVFSLLCDIADKEETEVIVELRYCADKKKELGGKWYRQGVKKCKRHSMK